MLQYHAGRKNVSGIVQAPLPLFWSVSKTAKSSIDLQFKCAEQIARPLCTAGKSVVGPRPL
jgi:hypothetical protein